MHVGTAEYSRRDGAHILASEELLLQLSSIYMVAAGHLDGGNDDGLIDHDNDDNALHVPQELAAGGTHTSL